MKNLALAFGFIIPVVLISSTAFAGSTGLTDTGVKYIAYFFAVAIAAYGGTASQSKAAVAALEGIARNPSAADKIQTPMILSFALMESLVIFTLISVFLAQ